MPNIQSTHVDTAQGQTNTFGKRIYSQLLTYHYHNVLPYLDYYHFCSLISILFFSFKSTYFFFLLQFFQKKFRITTINGKPVALALKTTLKPNPYD